jgi:hypothetical protein
MTTPSNGAILLAGLFAWGIFRRIRRNIGRQKLRPHWIIFRLVILSLVSVCMLFTAVIMPRLALSFGAGALLGAALSLLGLRHTKFETTADGHYYTPNTYIGVALSVLLVGRMLYRLVLLQQRSAGGNQAVAFQSPITMLILGLTVGYYLAYYTGLFIHTHDRPPDGPVA